MKYEVIGWTYCGNDIYPPHEHITACVDAAVVKEIRKHKYLFGGDEHEHHCPVLNDGTYVSYSWRGWGRIIALAYDLEGEYAYMHAYMNNMIKPAARKYPETGMPDDYLIVPQESLAETFVMHLADDMFEKMQAGTKTVEIRLFDGKRKLIDVGDYIEFVKQSNSDERIVRRVVNLSAEQSFEKLFRYHLCKNEEQPSELRMDITPALAGMPENADTDALVKEMYKYYDDAREKEYGVVAFRLEEPKHSCRTRFRIYIDRDNCLPVFADRLEKAGDDAEECERLFNEFRDMELVENALSEIPAEYKKFRYCMEYGDNAEYDADVNVMIRKTLEKLLGSEEKLKAVRDRYCVLMRLEIFAVTVKDSDSPKQNLSPDKDIIEFLHRSGAELKLGLRTV